MEKLTNKEIENLLNQYCFEWDYIHLERYNKNIISIKLKENLEINLYLEKFKFNSSYVTDDEFTLRDIKNIIRQYVLAKEYGIDREALGGSVTYMYDCIYEGILYEVELKKIDRLNFDYCEVFTNEQWNEVHVYRNKIIENVDYLTKEQKEFIKYKV